METSISKINNEVESMETKLYTSFQKGFEATGTTLIIEAYSLEHANEILGTFESLTTTNNCKELLLTGIVGIKTEFNKPKYVYPEPWVN